MNEMLSSGRVEPVVRPPSRATIYTRLPDLKETAQAEAGDLQGHSTEEAARSGFALKPGSRLRSSARGMICSVD
jgi:hypothetical protein